MSAQDGPQHITEALRRFLLEHEPMLREMAADEAERGEFTPGLSRCIDLLDQPNHADRVAPEKAAPPVVLPRALSTECRETGDPE